MPTENKEGPRHRKWTYSNIGYGLLGIARQNVYRCRYSTLLRDRILDPLKLNRTTITRSQCEDGNIAFPYVHLENGSFRRVRDKNNTVESNTPVLASMDMRSSVSDLLTWGSAVSAFYADIKICCASLSPSPSFLRSKM